MGVQIFGDARIQKPNTPLSEVREGDVLLTRYGKVSHVSYVVDTIESVTIPYVAAPVALVVKEANFRRCQTGTRTISINDPHIKGILRTYPATPPVNVENLV